MIDRLKTIAKWGWTLAILAIVVWFCVTRREMIVKTMSLLSVEMLVLATVCIILAKVGLTMTMRTAAVGAGVPLTFKEAYWIYNMTQLAKYVPGSIWQLVGRVVILKKRGAAVSAIRDAILSEHAWVVSTASIMAVALIFIAKPMFFLELSNNVGFSEAHWLWALLGLVAVVILGVAAVFRKRLMPWLWKLKPSAPALVVLALTWVLMGMSYWVTLAPFSSSPIPWYYAVGVYCLAYVAGFLVPFAPAGLGVREVILTFALVPFIPSEVAILLASINRVLYFVAELILVAPCLFWERPDAQAAQVVQEAEASEVI
ncbi:hypothetical protein QBK99_10450 [Corticibacterium sp. UT-5YL-CI-8]|nr:hypothetical protein [Tianweitania sp. UT-5YL-CI-8]